MTSFFFRPVIDLYKTRGDLAAVVGESAGTVQAWYNRDSIPSYAFRRMARDASKRVAGGQSEFESITERYLLELSELRADKPYAADAGAAA